ncbi:MAG: putative methylase, partial [Solirubrobacterales bacterium]|nr:putative methylase [Solirubrobacterales bacterium]
VAGSSVLELCTGSGAVALSAAHRGAARVVAVDRCSKAVGAVRANARLNRLWQVEARRGDLLGALGADERFDLIAANPPYLPAVEDLDPRWDAGADGRDVLDRILASAPAHLRPGGHLAIVQSGLADVAATETAMARAGLELAPTVEHRGPLGPLAAARRAHLERSGLLAPGETQELMAVVVGRRPADERELRAAA